MLLVLVVSGASQQQFLLNTLFYNIIQKQLKKHKMAPYSSSDIIQVYICTHNLQFLRALAQTSSSPWNKGVNNVFLK